MTKAKSFRTVVDQIVRILKAYHESAESSKLPDVKLMSILDFSPQSWKTWKTQLLQWFETPVMYENEDDEEYTWFNIHYDKKSRVWWAEPTESPKTLRTK